MLLCVMVRLVLPQPGLSEEGVVFSFQPYAISCFAAGVFHFTIPYKLVMPYLTDKAKRQIKLAQVDRYTKTFPL